MNAVSRAEHERVLRLIAESKLETALARNETLRAELTLAKATATAATRAAAVAPRKQKAILPDDQAAALAKAAERQRKVDLTKARQASEKATEDALEAEQKARLVMANECIEAVAQEDAFLSAAADKSNHYVGPENEENGLRIFTSLSEHRDKAFAAYTKMTSKGGDQVHFKKVCDAVNSVDNAICAIAYKFMQ